MAAEDDQLKRMIDRTDNPVLCTHLQDIPKNPSDHALLPLKRRVRDLLGNSVLEGSRCAPCIQHAVETHQFLRISTGPGTQNAARQRSTNWDARRPRNGREATPTR